MPPPNGRQLALPATLLKELGVQSQNGGGGGRRRQPSRKEQRKASRVEKKHAHRTPPTGIKRQNAPQGAAKPRTTSAPAAAPPKKGSKPLRIVNPAEEDDSLDEDDFDMDLDEDDFDEDGSGMEDEDEDEGEDEADSMDDTPQPSKSDRKKLDRDEAEITALEKKLGLKRGKKSKSDEDGLDDLLGDLDELDDEDDGQSASQRKRKAEADEWLAQKRRKANAAAAAAAASSKAARKDEDSGSEDGLSMDGSDDDDDMEDGLSDLGNLDYSGDEDLEDGDGDSDQGDDFDGFSDDDDEEVEQAPRVRENPYVAPTTNVAKYVPPSLRKQNQSMDEVDAQLRRRVQGLINRLTNENMLGILKDFTSLYDNFPRQSVTSCLVDLLITLVSSPEPRPDSFFTMIAGFVAAAQKALGIHVSANLVQTLVQTFKAHHDQASGDQSHAASKHLVALLAELYNMQVVGARLVFDYVRLFLVKLSELNTELLLKIIQICGPSLRREDPHALKEIINLIKPADLKNASVRTSFMMEEMRNLQANKSKAAARNKDIAELRTQIRKRIGTLSGGREVQPLSVGLKEIESADKNGKWWVVGASWSGNREQERATDRDANEVVDDTADFADDDDLGIPDLWQLAKQQGFNTEIRQQIFVALHSATDYENAELLLRKLRLNKYQRKELPEVIVRSGEAQAEFNKYYWLVASRFCGDREVAFQFKRCLTQRFRKMGEDIDTGDDFDADEDDYDTRQIVNLGKFYGNLVANRSLNLDILRYRNLAALQEKAQWFVEVLLITVLQESSDRSALQTIFGTLDPDLARAVGYFVKKHVRKTDLVKGGEKKALKKRCDVADSILEASLATTAE
ncbi:putative MI domain-containing protein [Seiridium cardinale]|uniref:MI domain-containing protein n=1 Tax=Seiridium cardinale TaxID=138064 RepID=A0ABR2XG36_9PEZI